MNAICRVLRPLLRTRHRLSPSRVSFRSRLALAFGALFLLTGTLLLAFVVLLARHGTAEKTEGISVSRAPVVPSPTASPPGRSETASPGGAPSPTEPSKGATRPGAADDVDGEDFALVRETVHTVRDAALQQMILWSVVGLVLMTLVAALIGRWLASRALRPVTAVTETALRMSEQSLDRRLALTGPDDELHRLADAFDSMIDRLQRSFDSQRRFVANASHELRTPLAAQRASIEVGLTDPNADDLEETREDLLATNREAERLIASLLLLAHGDRGLDRTEEVGLVEVAEAATAELRHLAQEKGLVLRTEFSAPGRVAGDPVLLRHLVSNLVGNALRYNRPGGRVDVTLHARTLTVTNTGRPVPPERVEELFEPFRRLGRDRTGTTGHGLGLSIVRSIARAHGAEPHAEPGPDGGLRVTVRFA
ncbi:ATP-binding protein [Streptomyces sp. NPDC005438]|uniref:sensor histidine kinase n=1 Tax=Streptomyces sp. NPDC005438 TaxID=3156880 RepID=UPI0033BEE940